MGASGVQGFEGVDSALGLVGLGGGGDDDLVGVGDHVRPVLAPGGVAAVHDDEPVVLLGDPVQGVHLGPGDFVGIGRRFVGAQDVVGILGLVVDEGGQLGRFGFGGEEVIGVVEKVQCGGVVAGAVGAPAQGTHGFVVVPGEHAGPAVAGELGGEQCNGGGLVGTALLVDDRDGAGADPVP